METMKINVGAKILFRIGANPITAWVIGDRGHIGVGGRQLLQIKFELGKDNWYESQIPLEEIEDVISNPPVMKKSAELVYMVVSDTEEGYSFFAKAKHAPLIAEFLRANNVEFIQSEEPLEGLYNFLVEKKMILEEFLLIFNRWKYEYLEAKSKQKSVKKKT